MSTSDGYRNDPMEQDPNDDAPFPGGSTEQKDGWLSDRARQDADYRAAYATAAANLAQQSADRRDEEAAWLAAAVDGRTFASRDVLHGYLLHERRIALGRRFTAEECDRIQLFAIRHWQAMTGQVAA